jgi:uncharacterized membrane protein YphA (DoxX/SURF4 family)
MLTNDWRFIAARVVEVIVGGVLLVAGLIKAYEMLDSIRQILGYNIVTSTTLVTILVWLLVASECAIGSALIVGCWRKYSVLATFGLFTIFLTFIGWSWATGSTENCGCFGSKLKHSPKEAFIFDSILLLALVITQFFEWQRTKDNKAKELTQTWKLVAVSLSLILGLSVATYASFSPKQSSDPVLRLTVTQPNPFQNIAVSLLNVDLQKGLQVVVLMDTGCDHCQANVPKFNDIFQASESLPQLTALCTNSPLDIKDFQRKFGAKFPIGKISDQDFLKLLEKGETPRIFLLNEGKVLKIWDKESPTVDELKNALPK